MLDAMIISKLRKYSTPCISDALDTLGVNGGLEGLLPIRRGMKVLGPVFSVIFEPVASGCDAPAADYLDEVPAGSVLLLANSGITYCTVWGSILTRIAKMKGIEGTVIDGCCRDIHTINEIDYPIFSKSIYMKSARNRVRKIDQQKQVKIGNILINPEDIVCGDDSGVIVVPSNLVEVVVDLCVQIESVEEKIMTDVNHGVTLQNAKKRHGYNHFSFKDCVLNTYD